MMRMRTIAAWGLILGLTTLAVGQVAEKAAIDAAKKPPAETAPASAPVTTAPDPGEADFQTGRTLFFQGQYAEAIDKLAAAVKAEPAKAAYKLLLAKAYVASRQKDSVDHAAAQLEAILKDNPEHVEAAVELGEILLAKGNYDRLIGLLEPLLKFKHDYPLYHMLAESYYQKEGLAKAREYFEQAVRLNPASGKDHYQLANIYLGQSNFARATDAYEKAQKLGIDSAVLHFKLASVYFNLRNYLGKVTVAQVIGGEPGQIKNDWLLLDSVPGKKDAFSVAPPASAAFQVVRAQQMGIATQQIRFLEANIWLNARRFTRADALYKSLEDKLDKADVGLFWFYWAQTALELDDYANYLARLDKAIAVEPAAYKPMLPDAYVTVARRYQQRGDNKLYIEFLAKAVAANPLSASLHLMLGDALWQLSEPVKAIEQYKLVLQLEPDHGERIRLLNRIAQHDRPPTTAPAKGKD